MSKSLPFLGTLSCLLFWTTYILLNLKYQHQPTSKIKRLKPFRIFSRKSCQQARLYCKKLLWHIEHWNGFSPVWVLSVLEHMRSSCHTFCSWNYFHLQDACFLSMLWFEHYQQPDKLDLVGSSRWSSWWQTWVSGRDLSTSTASFYHIVAAAHRQFCF